MRLKPITSKARIDLSDDEAKPPKKALRGAALQSATDAEVERISKLQRVLFADGRFALLIVLQGRDASGKDGTIRHVFRAVNPQGCEVSSFKAPTEFEQRHDFLWRVHARVPGRAMIGIFNRSHYEDVLAARVRKLVPKRVWSKRYDIINAFEQSLAEQSVVILKFFLHVSREEQKRRFIDRLTDETKNWKFRPGDLEDRSLWDEYTDAYRDAIRRCSTREAPWYLVPADDKDVRDYLIARQIADTLEALDLRYPPIHPEVKALATKIV
jgi:PPK2 family polyphosphate:nucleotide phosphotransferase